MDMYCSDKKLSELTDGPLGDFLDNDVFTPPVSAPMDHFGIDNSAMDSDWLENFFDDPVLNDRMISDALQPNVQSEHSYSLANSSEDQTLDLSISSATHGGHKDLDMDLTAVNPNHMSLTTGNTTILTGSQLIRQAAINSQIADMYIKQEPLDLSLDAEMTTVTVTRSTNPQTLLKQPTIILATSQQQQQHTLYNSTQKQERLVLPKVEFKMETQQVHHQQQQHHQHQQQQQQQQQQQRYSHSIMSSPEHSTESFDNLSLPPTPPSSTNSDSDGCDRSPPCSPHRSSRHRPSSPIIQQPFFMSPIPTSGILVLSEEEKRTLISEGYPIPGKLPLTKQEEKNLKKIRRKIKNKISAQESRRKKKEYLETLERKVETFSQENVDLRKKVDNLQNNNQSLMSQLHKLQAVVRNFRPLSPSGTQTGTCLMVLVLCFAVMLGSWSPMSLRMGYSSSVSLPASPSSISSSSSVADVGFLPSTHSPLQGLGVARQEPQVKDATTGSASGTYGPYATPNMRSRVLLSLKEEEDEEFGPHAPFSYKWLLGGFFGGCSASDEPILETVYESHEPTLPKVNVMDVEMEINQTGDIRAPSRQPDMAVTTSSKPINATA